MPYFVYPNTVLKAFLCLAGNLNFQLIKPDPGPNLNRIPYRISLSHRAVHLVLYLPDHSRSGSEGSVHKVALPLPLPLPILLYLPDDSRSELRSYQKGFET